MKKHLCNIHNISVELVMNNRDRMEKYLEYLSMCIDGFDEYYRDSKTDKVLLVRDIEELEIPEYAIVVPENAYYFDGIFYSLEARIAFRMQKNGMEFWAYEHAWYLPYILQLILEDENKTFIHGAGIAVHGEGILISAFGGIGKTCFIANAVKQENVKLLGDDLIIIRGDGYCYSYPRPFCLYEYHKSLFPQYFEGRKIHYETYRANRYFLRIQRHLKIWLNIKDNIVYDYLPVSPIHLFPKEVLQIEKVPIKKLFVMRRVKGICEISKSKASDVEKVANFTHDVIQHEWSIGIRLEYNYFAHKEENYALRAVKQYNIIKNAFITIPEIWYVDIPEKMSAEEVSRKLNELIL